MQPFEYASPATSAGSAGPARLQVGRSGCARRRHRSDQPDEGVRPHAQARREHQRHQGTARHSPLRAGPAHRRHDDLRRTGRATSPCTPNIPSLTAAVLGITSPQIRNMGTVGGDLCQRPRCWYFRHGYGVLALKDGKSLVRTGRTNIMPSSADGPAYFVSPSSLGPALVALGREVKLVSASGSRTVAAEKFFVTPQNGHARDRAAAERNPDRDRDPVRARRQERDLRSSSEGSARLAAGNRFRRAHHEWQER